MIHVLGDSHANVFTGFPGFCAHYLGSCTAHNLLDDEVIALGVVTHSGDAVREVLATIDPGEPSLFVFGGIDCRVQLYYKFALGGAALALRDYIDDTVDRYCKFVTQIKGRRVIVLSVVPAGYEGNVYNLPHYATPEVLVYIHKTFNQRLALVCKLRAIDYVSIYDRVALPDGMANREYLQDETHLNHKGVALVVEELKKLGVVV